MREYKRADTPTSAGELDSEDDEELQACPDEAALLGSRADKKALVQVLRRFSKDNLADESDKVVAAIRMQVKGVPPFRRLLNIVSTLGLWLLFQPREDSASLLLTKQGRFICWGRGQEAQPGAVRAYLGQVVCFLLILFVLMLGAWSFILRMQASFFVRGACLVFSILLLILLVSYCWAQRPRRDCGTTFRQHFDVQELCVGTYVRVDEGRRLSQLCARRRLGHLQLCFGRYPKEELLAERLPPGAPGCAHVRPLLEPPPALAGDSHEVQKEAIEQEGGLNSSFLTRIAAILAVLSLVGAAYDYTSFLDKVRIDGQLCLFKVHGCNWRVENSRLLGKVKRAEGANPPASYAEGGCTADGDYCDYFLRPTTHCSEKGEAFTNDVTAIHVRLECKVLPDLAEATKRVTYVNPYEGTGQVHTMFLIQHDLTVWSMPFDETSTNWNKVLLTQGMRIVQIGPEDSRENQNLQRGVALHPVELLERCIGEYRGHVDVALVETQDLVPMFKEDCQELQEACKAEGLGPETNGYWPPHRIFDHSYEKTICVYRSLKLPLWLGKVWNVLEQGERGLTCRGEPKKRIHFDHVNDSIVTERVETCKNACAREPWCTHVFYKGEVPEAFRTDFDFLPDEVKEKLRVHNSSRSSIYECLLYETCPVANLSNSQEDHFVPVRCGEDCGEDNQRCMMVRQGYLRAHADRFLGGRDGCQRTCSEAAQDVAQCNAFVYSPANHGTCTVYGPEPFLRPFEGWKTLDVNYLGAVGSTTDTDCYARSTDPFHLGLIRDRQHAGGPGILLRLTDQTTCGGCLERTLFEWLREPSAFCMVLSHLITLFGACYVARRAHASVQLGKAAFSGKPMVHMSIIQDPANNDNFQVREAAYRQFLSMCCEVAERTRNGEETEHQRAPEVDCWEKNGSKVAPIEAGNYESYDLSNKRRTKCYIDKELLGIQEGEKVRSAWSDTPRHGIYKMFFGLLFYYLILFLISWVAPENFKTFWTAVGFRPLFLIVIPCAVVLHHYIELRREVQSLCVLTSWGRLLHLTRRPNPQVFPAILCPAWYGGTSIQLESFKIGRISWAQLDMPAKPLLEDRLRSGFSEAWRRGSVTLRGFRGLLQVSREHGEALEMYTAFTSLSESRPPIAKLGAVGSGGHSIAGLCPRDEVLISSERHVWEHRFDAFGFFGDPFNYSTLLTLTDRRILVTRARWPKALSLVGCLIGPRTCSHHCSILQERWGYFPYITLTSVWYESLESYVTQRVRAPPFWPGFMKPIMSLSVNFLEKWMKSYPSALQVTQRPYGIPREVHVPRGAKIWLRSVEGEEKLRIIRSSEGSAPRGQYVEEVWEGGEELDLNDSFWVKGALAPEDAKLVLQAGDPEWDGYADEPWLHQMREILDHISGRSQARPETWEPLEDPPQPDEPNRFSQFMAKLVGAHMLGHRHQFPDEEEEDDDE